FAREMGCLRKGYQVEYHEYHGNTVGTSTYDGEHLITKDGTKCKSFIEFIKKTDPSVVSSNPEHQEKLKFNGVAYKDFRARDNHDLTISTCAHGIQLSCEPINLIQLLALQQRKYSVLRTKSSGFQEIYDEFEEVVEEEFTTILQSHGKLQARKLQTKALVISSEEYIERSKGAQSIVASTPILNADNQRKRPAEDAFPIITSPPNLRDRQCPRAQILVNIEDDDFFDDYNESEEEEESTEVIENEEVPTEVQNLIAKMREENYRLFDYQVVNLSENDLTDPVNKIFSNDDKEKMRKIWKEMEPSAEEKENTMRRSRWKKSIKPLIEKYAPAMPFEGEFALKKHYDMLWTQDIYRRFIFLFASSFNILRDANTQEIAYRDSFVNPLIPKVFDDILDKIRFQVGEIESSLRKKHRNETNGRKPRVNLGSKHDGILKIYMNATEMEIGFLEVVGNAVNVDVTGYYGDMERLFKAMQISIYYQRQHHLKRNATENQLSCLQSFGVLVYQRETTIYTMHRAKGGLHIVDIITNFTIPDSKDQAYVISEIIEKVYFFKSRVMDYYSKLQDISPKVQEYSHINENLLEASPSKRKSARR
ncbi:2581_t:CDS:10, partial [Funneliformis geosporum]